jgi:hypothetical protein
LFAQGERFTALSNYMAAGIKDFKFMIHCVPKKHWYINFNDQRSAALAGALVIKERSAVTVFNELHPEQRAFKG